MSLILAPTAARNSSPSPARCRSYHWYAYSRAPSPCALRRNRGTEWAISDMVQTDGTHASGAVWGGVSGEIARECPAKPPSFGRRDGVHLRVVFDSRPQLGAQVRFSAYLRAVHTGKGRGLPCSTSYRLLRAAKRKIHHREHRAAQRKNREFFSPCWHAPAAALGTLIFWFGTAIGQ